MMERRFTNEHEALSRKSGVAPRASDFDPGKEGEADSPFLGFRCRPTPPADATAGRGQGVIWIGSHSPTLTLGRYAHVQLVDQTQTLKALPSIEVSRTESTCLQATGTHVPCPPTNAVANAMPGS